MDSGNFSLADIAAVVGKDAGGFGGNFMWIFALLILLSLLGGGFNGFGNRGGGDAGFGVCQWGDYTGHFFLT